VGLLHLSRAYLERLAGAVPGAYIKEGSKPTSSYVAKDGTYVAVADLLANAGEWRAAILEFTAAVSRALKDQ
jgi:hypothetical protein